MYPVLLEIGPLPAWAAAAMALALALVGGLLEVVEERRLRMAPRPLRIAGIAALGAAIGLTAWWMLGRWGPIQVRAWGTMLMLGFIAGMLWLMHDTRGDDQLTTDVIIDLTLVILVGAVIGARALSVALQWETYAQGHRAPWEVWSGGLSFHGGLLGGILAAALFLGRRRIGFWRVADLVAPSIALGYAITRVGCLLNGCCHGVPTTMPWGVHLPAVDGGQVARHPTQLYAAAASLLIFALLLVLRRHLHRDGHLLLSYFVLYSVARFAIEHFRRGASAEIFAPLAPLTVAQVASIAIILGAGGWLLRDHLRDRGRPHDEQTAAAPPSRPQPPRPPTV
ncbi:MAG: prolipoprotein diacylglyceryl transferase [Armatimonadota bacterium]|nr:prolipoprotein diacylglyceryl transferase [Armatimonadota bacterium]